MFESSQFRYQHAHLPIHLPIFSAMHLATSPCDNCWQTAAGWLRLPVLRCALLRMRAMVALCLQLLFKRIELDNLASVVAPAVLAVNTLQLSQVRGPLLPNLSRASMSC